MFRTPAILVNLLLLSFLTCALFPQQEEEFNIHIISQVEWGGDQWLPEKKQHDIKQLTIHHSASALVKDRVVSEYLLSLQSWSQGEKKWVDIPYHFMIDLDGNIYEGRSPDIAASTNTNYDTRTHMTTCLIGNFENTSPSIEQLESLISLLAWQCDKYGVSAETIAGHKDHASETVCPGENLYRYISTGFLTTQVEKRIGNVGLK